MSAPAAPLPGELCPGQSTWDQSPPVRPGTSTFNGAALQNANGPGIPPPNPGTHPTAALLNTWSLLLVAIGKVIPNVILSVTGGTTPAITLCSAASSSVAASSFTVVRNSAGNVTISWPVSILPPPVAWPVANHVGALANHNYHLSCTSVTVTGTTASTTIYSVIDASPGDLSFVLFIY